MATRTDAAEESAAGSARAQPLLEVTGLEVVYQDVIQAVRGISMVVPHGAIVSVLGPNGAGKTTLLRSLAGLLDFHRGKVTKGTIRFDGMDITGVPPHRIAQLGMGQVLEDRRLLGTLTVEENIRVGARGRLGREMLEASFELFPVLKDRRDVHAGYLSGGEQQMLAMARGLAGNPRVLVLDEPSLGLAPKIVAQVAGVIRDIRERGTTVLLVEQNARLALDLADHSYVIENGRVVLEGPTERVREDADVLEFYLGMHSEGGRRNYADVKHYRRRKRWLS